MNGVRSSKRAGESAFAFASAEQFERVALAGAGALLVDYLRTSSESDA